MKKIHYKQIGQRIREARIRRYNGSVNMKDFASDLGIPYRTYQNWELGIHEPKHDTVILLANRLKVDPGWLEYGPEPKVSQSIKDLIKTHFPKNKERI
jgi:transcriptional regulator with XRE-family HTH domain